MMTETESFFWTDRPGRTYCNLRMHGGHWRVEWGYRDPPGGDAYLQRGAHESSVQQDAVRRFLEHVRDSSDEPDEAPRVKEKLDDWLESLAP